MPRRIVCFCVLFRKTIAARTLRYRRRALVSRLLEVELVDSLLERGLGGAGGHQLPLQQGELRVAVVHGAREAKEMRRASTGEGMEKEIFRAFDAYREALSALPEASRCGLGAFRNRFATVAEAALT